MVVSVEEWGRVELKRSKRGEVITTIWQRWVVRKKRGEEIRQRIGGETRGCRGWGGGESTWRLAEGCDGIWRGGEVSIGVGVMEKMKR